jgi:hypothetical protein
VMCTLEYEAYNGRPLCNIDRTSAEGSLDSFDIIEAGNNPDRLGGKDHSLQTGEDSV